MRKLLFLAMFGLVAVPAAVFAIHKPLRVVAPEWAGVSCPQGPVCVDDEARRAEAERLYADALRDVQSLLGPIRQAPRAVFCSTRACFQWFGGDRNAGMQVGTFGIILGPRGWRDFYVRHELIHHWQAERLGVIAQWRMPEWLREGMAYDLSGDPRPAIAEPLESYRQKFRAWNAERGGADLVEALRRSH